MKRDSQFILFGLTSQTYSFKGLNYLALLYIGSLAFAALASPLVFQLVHAFDPEQTGYLANKPYPDYFDRARWIFVLLVLPYIFKKCGLFSGTSIGLKPPALKTYAKWALFGIGMMATIYGLGFVLGTIEPRDNWTIGRQIEKSSIALVSATLIGTLEELVFRGIVFRIFYTAFKPLPAVLLSSMFFAFLHFKMSDELLAHVPWQDIGFDDAAFAAWQTIAAFADGFNLLSFINLTLVGILLHQCFLITQNLWACIGLHAGWVFIILGISKTFQETEQATLFTGTEKVADGIWVGVVMIIFAAIFAWTLNQRYYAKTTSDS